MADNYLVNQVKLETEGLRERLLADCPEPLRSVASLAFQRKENVGIGCLAILGAIARGMEVLSNGLRLG